MHHTSCIMCIVTVWHPSIGNIIPISGYITLDTPVTVVTSGELQNRNRAVSETETWQPYGALLKHLHSGEMLTEAQNLFPRPDDPACLISIVTPGEWTSKLYLTRCKSQKQQHKGLFHSNDMTVNSRIALVPAVQSVSRQAGGGPSPLDTHRVLHHIDVTSISFLVLSHLLPLARPKTNAGGIYCRLAANRLA